MAGALLAKLLVDFIHFQTQIPACRSFLRENMHGYSASIAGMETQQVLVVRTTLLHAISQKS